MKQLKHTSEFKQLLATYQVSPQARQLLQQTPLVLLVAPSGTGRNRVINELIKTGHYYYLISDTTRSPRLNDGVMERSGQTYWFRTEAEFLADLRAGKYVEAAIIHNQQVSGINIREFKQARDQHKIALTDVDIRGADTLLRLKPETRAIFVLPPSFTEWLRRLQARGPMPPAELKRRLISAQAELAVGLTRPYYHFVVNDNPATIITQIEHLATTAIAQPRQSDEDRQLVGQLHDEVTAFLADL